jgi:hypothetical protein
MQEEHQPKERKSPLVKVSEFSFGITPKMIKSWSPFLFFIFIWAMIYIANAHYANKVIVKSAKLMSKMKELRSEYISIKKDLMSSSKQSEVTKRLEGTGILPLRKPPVKIIAPTKTKE